MKKTFLLALLCCLFAIGFAGNPVPANDARTVSVNFIKSIYPDMNVTASDFVLQHTEMDENGEPLFYQFAIGEQGFILISANDAVEPVLAYSLSNNFDKNLPIYAVSAYRDMIAGSKDKVDEAALRSWKKLLPTNGCSTSPPPKKYSSSSITPSPISGSRTLPTTTTIFTTKAESQTFTAQRFTSISTATAPISTR